MREANRDAHKYAIRRLAAGCFQTAHTARQTIWEGYRSASRQLLSQAADLCDDAGNAFATLACMNGNMDYQRVAQLFHDLAVSARRCAGRMLEAEMAAEERRSRLRQEAGEQGLDRAEIERMVARVDTALAEATV